MQEWLVRHWNCTKKMGMAGIRRVLGRPIIVRLLLQLNALFAVQFLYNYGRVTSSWSTLSLFLVDTAISLKQCKELTDTWKLDYQKPGTDT